MEGYSAFPKAPALLKPQYLIVGWVSPLCRDAVGVFYSPGKIQLVKNLRDVQNNKVRRYRYVAGLWRPLLVRHLYYFLNIRCYISMTRIGRLLVTI